MQPQVSSLQKTLSARPLQSSPADRQLLLEIRARITAVNSRSYLDACVIGHELRKARERLGGGFAAACQTVLVGVEKSSIYNYINLATNLGPELADFPTVGNLGLRNLYALASDRCKFRAAILARIKAGDFKDAISLTAAIKAARAANKSHARDGETGQEAAIARVLELLAPFNVENARELITLVRSLPVARLVESFSAGPASPGSG